MEAFKSCQSRRLHCGGFFLLALLFDFAVNLIAENHPFWAWKNGTPAMQKKAIPTIIGQIGTGDELAVVVNKLGPGSLDWPEKYEPFTKRLVTEGEVSFGIRSQANIGILISIRDGKVERIRSYR